MAAGAGRRHRVRSDTRASAGGTACRLSRSGRRHCPGDAGRVRCSHLVTPLLGLCPCEACRDAVGRCQRPVRGGRPDRTAAWWRRAPCGSGRWQPCPCPHGAPAHAWWPPRAALGLPSGPAPPGRGVAAAVGTPLAAAARRPGRALARPSVGHAKAVFPPSTVSPFKLQDTRTSKTSGPPRHPTPTSQGPPSLQGPWADTPPGPSRHRSLPRRPGAG